MNRRGPANVDLATTPMDVTGEPDGFAAWVAKLRQHTGHAGAGHGKFTPARRAILVGSIASGGSVEVAARRAGIHATTLRDWIRKGQAELQALTAWEQGRGQDPGPTPYGELILEILMAIGFWETELLGVLKKAAKDGDVKAACWLLERVGGKLGAERIEIDMKPGHGPDDLGDVRARLTEQWAQIRARRTSLENGDGPGEREDE